MNCDKCEFKSCRECCLKPYTVKGYVKFNKPKQGFFKRLINLIKNKDV